MNTRKQFLPALTAMRGLAAWWVVLYHFRGELPQTFHSVLSHGDLAVDFFFELSGFVLSLSYADALSRPRWAAYGAFLKARIARIYPLYIVILLTFIINPIAIAIGSARGEIDSRYSVYYFLLSIPMIQNWGFTDALAWNIPAWSISTEWAAYLLFPLYVWIGHRLANTAARSTLILSGFLVVLASCCYASGHTLGADIPRFGLWRCLLEFGAGVALHGIWRDLQSKGRWRARQAIISALGLIGLYLGGYCSDFLVMPFAFALIIFAGASCTGLSRNFANRFFLMLGDVSYSTYLIHFLVRDWVKFIIVGPGVPAAAYFSIYIVLVFGLSVFLYYWIELPARGWLRPGNSSERQRVLLPIGSV